jgi:DNA-binding response OmpR family regulator
MTRPLVAVAHEDKKHRETAAAVLREAGFRVIAVADGASALELVRTGAAALLVASVALQSPPFYQICEVIKETDLSTRVLVVASVYSTTAYKRKATELYGADDSVEEHQIADKLVAKVEELLRAGAGGAEDQ